MTDTKDPTGKVIAEILAGRHDGRLEDIAKAMKERWTQGAVAFYWRLRFGDDEWTEETVTLGEIQVAERLAGTTWENLNPRASAHHCLTLIVAHLHKIGGLTITEAREKAEALRAAEIGDVLDEYEVVNPPKDSSTSTPS